MADEPPDPGRLLTALTTEHFAVRALAAAATLAGLRYVMLHRYGTSSTLDDPLFPTTLQQRR
jgi:hypothetical protein